MGRLSILLLLLISFLAGCSSRTSADQWVIVQGGTVNDQRLERARRVTAAVCDRDDRLTVAIAVLDRDDLSAFSWPSGHIFVSRGLMDSLDDTALSAAIAHEIAHVLNHKNSNEVTALRGSEARLAEEVRADRLGVQLLEAAGIPGNGMAMMLERLLEDGGLRPQVQASLRRRITLLCRSSHVD